MSRIVAHCPGDEVVLRLAGPPPEGPARHYTVGLAVWHGKTLGVSILDFPQAWWEHFPGVAKPTHLLVWTPGSLHLFDYHTVDYAYEVKDP